MLVALYVFVSLFLAVLTGLSALLVRDMRSPPSTDDDNESD